MLTIVRHPAFKFKPMDPKGFAALGLYSVAYIKPKWLDGRRMWVVHAADGTELGGMFAPEIALSACLQNDLEALSVH